ncbi:MAG: SDR family NAD(P)-dependent oxidoreductase [Nostoc sp.]|uniref:SDR family NAD(P)-dependent oxidoreductase n=1 Tax=Nostoc sp. TaxID=1180 RepID=UPI002FFA7660
MSISETPNSIEGIAIIGMAGGFPGAKSIDKFWQNIRDGVESIAVFSDEELLSEGIKPTVINDPKYIKSRAVLEDIDLFDASFFGVNPKEAEITDPQHRLFLEYAWEALENAGYDSQRCESRIGVYAGSSSNNYLSLDLNSDACGGLRQQVGLASIFQKGIGNDKDFLATRVSYKLNLTGPSLTVQTACSTSLVAISLACQSLLNYQCDMALAGGVSIHIPQKTGYLYEEGGILSPDGHCRAFDAKAKGTIIGNGLGIVVLKRLSEAIADGDNIYAVIKSSAINNDGSGKVGYTAPSVNGQADVIAEALALAGLEPETISYVEAHGTGTVLGDPIEISALTNVFRESTDKKGFCAIASVKTNIGHLDAAAGIAGLIKTVLALKHQQIPPSLNFEQPNPQIDFANSPFYVNTKLTEWKTNGVPRRAGVSSLGIGGTNAHVILEEAPVLEPSSPSRPWQLLLLSAKTDSALETATENLIQYLKQHSDITLADVAHTLQVGRREFNHRRVLVCEDIEDAINALQVRDPQRVFTNLLEVENRPIAFMFPGQGAQYVDMGKELYQTEPIFREQVDLCCKLLQPHIGLDLRSLIYPSESESEAAAQKLQQTHITQPALFVIEYALAQLWMSWGISPQAMIGHSIGEYVAACLASVMSLGDALGLVAARGRLMQQLPSGAMLSVPLPEEEVKALLDEKLSLAASNAPALCVVSGTHDAIDAFQNKLQDQGIDCRRLHTSHAFHSPMMEPILEAFQKEVSKVKLHPPKIPFVSNVTGTWITAEQATDSNYWAKHLRQTVRFAAGIYTLLQEPNHILLEVGPGRTLCSFTKKHLDSPGLSSLRHPKEKQSDITFLLNTLGKLWLYGVQVDWSRFYTNERRHRLPLPTYPFERQRYWIEPEKLSPSTKGNLQRSVSAPELWKSLVEVGQFQAGEGIKEFDNHTYLANKQSLEHLCTAYMNLALKGLGAFNNPSQNYSLEELFEQCQVIPHYRQLLCRWLDVLVERGHLKQDGELFTNLLPLSADCINSLVKEFRIRWADIPQQIELVQNFGENLADILIGKKEPLKLYAATLAKEGEISRQNLPADIYFNAIIQASLEVVIKSLPSEVNLRILEIGGGTGIVTAELLPILLSKQTNYTFTDVGGFFLTEAEKEFSAYPFVEYRLLNIEQPPSEQGYESHSFDVVVAVNVLHVTQNIGKTLEHVRSLLAPEGLLLIQEITQPQLDFDMIDGLLMNPLEDEQRSSGNPFLSKEQWQEALRNHGFVEVEAFSEIDAFEQYVFVAQASASTALPAASAFTVTFEPKDAESKLQVSLHEKLDISDWFYIPSWKRLMPPQLFSSKLQATQPGCWLVFIDECGLGDKIVQRLTLEGNNAIIVRIGEQFSSEIAYDQRVYTINPRRQDDYYALIKELSRLDLTPNRTLHLWNLTSNSHTELTIDSLERCETLGFYSLVFLAQALAEQQSLTNPMQIEIVSNNLQEVTGSEVLDPGKAFVLGPCKVIQQEYPNITCRSIDIVIPATENWQQEKLVNQLLAEFTIQSSDRVVAYRGNYRWVQTFEPVRLDRVVEAKPQLRERGVYLITGGLGGVGLFNAEYLAKTLQAKLILIGRSAFPNQDEWSQWLSDYGEQDSVSRKILKLQELEALGAEVLVVKADVTNREQMEAAITHANNRFGQINGVIHNAVESQQEFFAQKTLETGRIFLAPKVIGTIILDNLFKDTELDFFVLTSSQASVLGGIGLVEYTAECAFIDAFAYYSASKKGRFIRSINWNRWNTPEWITQTNLDRVSELTLEEAGLTLEEGMEAFRRILFCSTIPQVVVSKSDFNNLINRNLINLKDTLNALEEEFTKVRRDKPTHPRPNLVNAYVAPRTEIEGILTDIWQEIFSIEQVGIHDNFFELRGDSLLATIVISRIRKTFNIELSHQRFFDEPNIAELALVIEEMILEELEKFSEVKIN